jgi:serine/threonine protein kinase
MIAGERAALELDYSEILRRLGCAVTIRGPWASVGTSPLVQGWKLHVSSVPTQAVDVLHEVVPMLVAERVPFKAARSAQILHQMNEGELGATQVGKFMTVYPPDPAAARELGLRLAAKTAAVDGPEVVTDLHVGGTVYARYGGVNPLITRDRLGQAISNLHDGNGRLRRDAYSVPFVPPDDVDNPFADLVETTTAPDGGSKLLGPGYLPLQVIRAHAKGSVYLAMDLRTQEDAHLVVLKQGRRFCLSDEHARDMRTRLRRQQQLHERLQSLGVAPFAFTYFEADGHGYLPLEWLPGRTIESVVVETLAGRSWSEAEDATGRLVGYVAEAARATLALHEAGFVHRDLTASNVWVTEECGIRLLDLELAHEIGDDEPAYGLGTAGFMSPQQEAREAPAFADDSFGLGCVLILVLTGLDPRRVLFRRHDRAGQLRQLTGGCDVRLLELAAACTSRVAHERPSVAEIAGELARLADEPASKGRFRGALPLHAHDVETALAQGLEGIVRYPAVDEGSGMWLSVALERSSSAAGAAAWELRCSANRGVAGIVYTAARAALSGFDLPAPERVGHAIEWLTTKASVTPDASLPGLHFGRAGIAVALVEAVRAGIVDDSSALRNFVRQSLDGAPDWPDVTHGSAGQGTAALLCADYAEGPFCRDVALRHASYLVREQRDDGSWTMPDGVTGMSGETLTGFAHGAAGIVYFLDEVARLTGDQPARAAADRGLEWLLRRSIRDSDTGALVWPYSLEREDRWRWWCHGSPGIALTFLRRHEVTGDEESAEVARAALKVQPPDVRHPNLTQCHGLSGLGEAYLEAARVLGEPEWGQRAEQVVKTILALRAETSDGRSVWLAEDPVLPAADLMVGSGGIVHFLLRTTGRCKTAGPPIMFGPVE